MSSPVKSLKKKIERLIDLERYNTVRIKLIKDKAIDELNLMLTNEITIFNDIRTEILIIKEKINPERLKDFLDESEMNAVEIKLNAVIEILENQEKKIRNRIGYLKKSNSELLDLHRRCYKKSVKVLMYLHIHSVFNKSVKEIRKEL